MNNYLRLLQFVKPYWIRLSGSMVCMVILSLTTGMVAYLIGPAVKFLFDPREVLVTLPKWVPGLFRFEKDQVYYLLPLAIVLVYLVKGLSYYGQSYLMGWVGQKIIDDLRNKLYQHIQSLSLSFFAKNPTGSLISRITYDITLIQGAVSRAVTAVLRDSFTIVVLIGLAFYLAWKLAIIAFVVFPLAVIPIVKFGRKLRRISTQRQKIMGGITSMIHETFSGARIVKAFGREQYESKRFSERAFQFFREMIRAIRVQSISAPLMEFFGAAGLAGAILFASYLISKGELKPEEFLSFFAALIWLYEPIKRLSGVNETIQAGLAAATRVFNILDQQPEIKDAPGARTLPPVSRGIEFSNVSFKYDDTLVLKKVNLKIIAGEMIALVGISGAGKTSLVNLVPRFYEANEGTVLLDGKDIREFTIKSLRAQIGIVTQQVILFNDTVRNNIAYGDISKSEEDIFKAAKAANAHDFIIKLPEGYDTVIGEGGGRLSGGERQRLAIARALLKDAPILILDEATSSLDAQSEGEVQKALETLMQGRTTFVIAHRLSTIKKADRIIVIANGEVLEEGKHQELLKRKGEYYRLYEKQFTADMTEEALVN
ncbi:MAG: lipid A export permease/ATP-binding protein MsbA [Deltaproteobacteria bacterium]|nr:MAG: lipid A export permease/ATP-binding protein MsbA [Deltaproteobacteria bacterium]